MSIRRLTRVVIGALVATLALLGVQLGAATAASAQASAPRVLKYDLSQAQEFAADWEKGAAVWNSLAKNVRLEKGTPANIRILTDNGWPRAQPGSLGNGTVWMGRQAVRDGHYPPRITAHELGHILGLPDIKPGPCSSLMSGASAGTSCKNTNPNAQELARVERLFARGVTSVPAAELVRTF